MSDSIFSALVRRPALPLSGTRVLVTRAPTQSESFRALLEGVGASVSEMPALAISPPSSWQSLDQSLLHLADFEWIIFTSSNGVDFFWNRCSMLGIEGHELKQLKIAVVGQKTAERLQSYGLQANFIPPHFVADSLVEHFPHRTLAGVPMLYPCLESGGREFLVEEFAASGACISAIPAYQSTCVASIPAEIFRRLGEGQIDIITFASPKTVQCFYKLVYQAFVLHPSALKPQLLVGKPSDVSMSNRENSRWRA
jgi:uroporphyrinogen-III synthase